MRVVQVKDNARIRRPNLTRSPINPTSHPINIIQTAMGVWYCTIGPNTKIPHLHHSPGCRISVCRGDIGCGSCSQPQTRPTLRGCRSEEHTSELQSRGHLVCRLLL